MRVPNSRSGSCTTSSGVASSDFLLVVSVLRSPICGTGRSEAGHAREYVPVGLDRAIHGAQRSCHPLPHTTALTSVVTRRAEDQHSHLELHLGTRSTVLRERLAGAAIVDRLEPWMAKASLQGCIHGVSTMAAPARRSTLSASRHTKKGLQLQPSFVHAGRSHESTTDQHTTVLNEERRKHQTQNG